MENSSADAASRVRAIIIEQLGIDPARAVDEASIVDDLGADYLEVAQIVMMIEDEFNIEISDDVAEAVITVGDVIYVVMSKTES
ncbi:acyl carrier protein [Sinorhizobium meliloti SM11]|uniref:Acyl carrier protein n=1 Tax=Sinorhizobium meliloti (strain SM11) TaxID=707241 RepID=F7X478_SINMM|nr:MULTISPECIES: acyl carrier protein [Sinorhizobium]AEH79664.1 acyl carrier protein [Sinorhizobium meliloti SM11]MDE4557476.1 acyl carrier protein [Sinorhizobium meliloti SM11]MDX0930571.1 acyl carrier protein [Sinorhizobium medicae]WQO53277.1 acyl carrier protein [Sinorhizobium medicae]WQO57158.1 acyl carrier protein [Sinorhizobium medicae]